MSERAYSKLYITENVSETKMLTYAEHLLSEGRVSEVQLHYHRKEQECNDECELRTEG